ncbi:MAG: DUF538 domain-containing protein [Proteobacteria bacterium]|nr:DUF538 domain-containing protein [Pseudomonadota bacterium]
MDPTADPRTREVLRDHQLPEGLLPAGIVEAEIGDDGRFSVTLPKRIERKHGGYRVRYATQISGQLAQGRVQNLKGVEAKQMMWFKVGGIAAKSEGLAFEVGPVTVALPLSEFPLV